MTLGQQLHPEADILGGCLQITNIRMHVIELRACKCLPKQQASISTPSGLGVMRTTCVSPSAPISWLS